MRKSVIAAAALAAVGVGGGLWWAGTDYETVAAHPSYAVGMDTPARAAGWADDVFVGRVARREGATRSPDGLLWTTYEVRVERRLKGAVTGTVRVAQEGGEDPATREKRVVGEAPALVVGRRYVLASRVSADGWHTVPSNFVPADPTATGAWERAVAAPERQADLRPSAAQAGDAAALYRGAVVG